MEKIGRIYAIIGDNTLYAENIKKEIYILDHINKYTKKDKIDEALKMVNLNEDYLLIKSNDLSNVEYNKLLLVNDLVNKKDIIYLNYFEKGLCHKEREYFKKLFKKLSRDYGINFVIRTNDFSFCIDLVDEYHIYKDRNLTDIVIKKDIHKKEIYKYYNKHKLIDFIIKSRKYNHLMDDYDNFSDLLKAICRETI